MLGPRERKGLFLSRGGEELYDIRADPLEVDNLAADPAYSTVLPSLTADAAAAGGMTKVDGGSVALSQWRQC